MTKAEKAHHDAVAALGCIACRIDGIFNTHVSIHHVEGRTKPGCEMKVLALCGPHHQTGGKEAPAIHPWKKRFTEKYGTQEELMEMTAQLLNH
jgi:hypothetical protein